MHSINLDNIAYAEVLSGNETSQHNRDVKQPIFVIVFQTTIITAITNPALYSLSPNFEGFFIESLRAWVFNNNSACK